MSLHLEILGNPPTELMTPGPVDPVKSSEFEYIVMFIKDYSQEMLSLCWALPLISVRLSHERQQISQDSLISDLCN